MNTSILFVLFLSFFLGPFISSHLKEVKGKMGRRVAEIWKDWTRMVMKWRRDSLTQTVAPALTIIGEESGDNRKIAFTQRQRRRWCVQDPGTASLCANEGYSKCGYFPETLRTNNNGVGERLRCSCSKINTVGTLKFGDKLYQRNTSVDLSTDTYLSSISAEDCEITFR